MEMHIVHRNRIYSNLSNALNHKNGLVVLGIFFQVSSRGIWNFIFQDIIICLKLLYI